MLIQIFLGILDAGARQLKSLFRTDKILRLAQIHSEGREAGERHTRQKDQEQERSDQDDSGLRFEGPDQATHKSSVSLHNRFGLAVVDKALSSRILDAGARSHIN